jgi:hypothetical protein
MNGVRPRYRRRKFVGWGCGHGAIVLTYSRLGNHLIVHPLEVAATIGLHATLAP